MVSLFNFEFCVHAEKSPIVTMGVLPSFRHCAAVDTGPVTVVDATEGTDCMFREENKRNSNS